MVHDEDVTVWVLVAAEQSLGAVGDKCRAARVPRMNAQLRTFAISLTRHLHSLVTTDKDVVALIYIWSPRLTPEPLTTPGARSSDIG